MGLPPKFVHGDDGLEPGALGATAVAIGNFDGVHTGHAHLVEELRGAARNARARAVVLTFDPHPALVLGRTPPPLLTRLGRKAALLCAAGVDHVVVRPFTEALSQWTPERFVEELLVDVLGARAVLVGENFRFGHKRAGDVGRLTELGKRHGFDVHPATLVSDDEGPISSSRIRRAVAAGDVEGAARMLGRPHMLTGIVEHGDARGRTIGFPTANVGGVVEALPPLGVYAVRAAVSPAEDDTTEPSLAGVMNLGVRPTVDDGLAVPRAEVHLLDYDGDLYGKRLAVSLVARIRDERKMESLDALRAQIARDVDAARAATSR